MKVVSGLFFLVAAVWAKPHSQNEVGVNIINGMDAFPGQFPYVASIQHKTNPEISCTGALIDEQWVVSAVSCFGELPLPDASDFRVVLGLHDLEDESSPNTLVLDVLFFYTHSQIGPYRNNFVLLKLSAPVPPHNPYIQTIAFGEPHDDFTGANCNIIGWGSKYANGPRSNILQYQIADIITREECAERGADEEALNWNMCTYNGLSGTCLGDGGAPLVCRKDSITYLVGNAYAATEDCNPKNPSLFVRTHGMKMWIMLQVIGML